MNYNIIAALCAYNWGYDDADEVINKYALSVGLTRAEVLESSSTNWVDLFEGNKGNDVAFPRMVLSYLDLSKPFNNMRMAQSGKSEIVRTTVHNSLVMGMK